MKITQKKVVTMVDEVQYEAGDVLLCTKSDSNYYDIGSHYLVLSADPEEGDLVLTDNIDSTIWNTYNFNDEGSTFKFEFVLSVKGCGQLVQEGGIL